jgi:hypothetical protein
MRKLLPLAVALAMFSAVGFAQRGSGMQFRGIPASVTSPRPDGTFRGIPASVTDPRAGNGFGFRGSVTFGNARPFQQHHRRPAPVFVVPYYAYPYVYDSSYYEEPQQQQQVQPQVIVIKDETSRAADDSRYGEHSFEGSDSDPARDEVAQSRPAPAPPEATDLGPMTTLVFRDGHKSEVRNYAIVGTNLLDLTKSPVMKKIPLASLDLDATRRENENNGVDFHLP